MKSPDNQPAPALKELFDIARLQHIAVETAAVFPAFDARHFLERTLVEYDNLSLMQRLHRVTQSLHEFLPNDYEKTLAILRQLAPRLNNKFVTLILPHYVALYGAEHFDVSLDALKFFTCFGSSEYAVRHFLQRDLEKTLNVMTAWSMDNNEHVRRLASEGCRPRLPWSFHIEALRTNPDPVAPIIQNLMADPSLYVRKSVANHLNDIAKDNPGWVLDRLDRWDTQDANTAWIVKHGLRTLIKKGDQRALALIGATGEAAVAVANFTISPGTIRLGDEIVISFGIASKSTETQRLVIDYAIHYIKKSGLASAKVFKIKTVALSPGETLPIQRRQSIRNFTTREHYFGMHKVELIVNGKCVADSGFDLVP